MKLQGSILYALHHYPEDEHVYSSVDLNTQYAGLGHCYKKFVPPSCPNWPNEHGADESLPEIQDFYATAGRLGDVLYYPGTKLIREDLVESFQKEGFTGLNFNPVNLFKGRHCTKPLPGFSEMRVLGRVKVDEMCSGLSVEYRCPICGYVKYAKWDQEMGLHFEGDEEDWPDAFMMEQMNTLYVFVKPRLANFIVDLQLQPVVLTRLEDFRI